MSVTTRSISRVPTELPLPVHRFSVRQYHRMIACGVLTENDPVELLEGWVISKMPHNPAYDATVSMILRSLWTRLPDGWIVRVQSAITLADSEPEPDLAVVRGPEERYLKRHPLARDIALVIEVSDATLGYDQTIKARVYARARIPMYWVVNLPGRSIEVRTLPKGGKEPAYRERRVYSGAKPVPLLIEGRNLSTITARELLP
jgi:Uma2 family endonuclease